MHPQKFRILVVDDEPLIASILSEILELAGYTTRYACSPDVAFDLACPYDPHLLISDVSMPGRTGIELGLAIKKICPDCEVLLITGDVIYGDRLLPVRQQGYHFTLWQKPVPPRQILAHVDECLQKRAATAPQAQSAA